MRIVRPGATGNENAHLYPHVSDWTVSLDELQALCPNLQHVSLVVAWFGDDLRCGTCTIAPRVERVGTIDRRRELGGIGLDARQRRASSTHGRWSAGLWRHAIRRCGARGNRRPQGAAG